MALFVRQVLREAKEREELQTAETESSDSEKKVVAHYGMLFDEFQGLSHLEALEIQSRESESKVKWTFLFNYLTVPEGLLPQRCVLLHVLQVKSVLTTLSGDELVQLRGELDHIKDSFSLVEFDDEEVDEKKGNAIRTASETSVFQQDCEQWLKYFQMKTAQSSRGS